MEEKQHTDPVYSRGCPDIHPDNQESGMETSSHGCNKLNAYNWLEDIDTGNLNHDIVEIRFKNTRKGYYSNSNNLRLKQGDIVAVEASPGHDIGVVSLTGDLVYNQLAKNNIKPQGTQFKKVYRKAKQVDTEKWFEAIDMEHQTMIRARQLADDLKLNMKIGDVEYQGDKTKAIFYYIADERVDFRELIKVLADAFRVRIEMKQIGARQEAGRIGGIGPCGRELCCATWISNFVSVTTNAARYQDISLNPQKLAGQCGKLKCCLNYELPCYLDALEDFPAINTKLETEDGTAYCQKRDIYRRIMWFSLGRNSESVSDFIALSVETVKASLELNAKGKPVQSLKEQKPQAGVSMEQLEYQNVVGQDSITRFEEKKDKGSRKRKKNYKKNKGKRNK